MITTSAARDAFRAAFRRGMTRVVYGDDHPLSHNFLEDRRLIHMRQLNPGGARSPAAFEAAARLHSAGWSTAPPAAGAVMAAVIRGYRHVIEDSAATIDMGGRIPGAVRYVIAPHERVPAMKDLLDEEALDILWGYYGTHFRLQHCRMWRISWLPEEQRRFHHYGNLWHLDDHPRHTMKMFVQISEGVEESTGALRLHDIPSTKLITRAYVLGGFRAAYHLRENRRPEVVFDGPPGARLFCNPTRCLHRAGVPAQGQDRGMIQFTFEPSPEPVWDHFAAMGPDTNVIPGRTA